MHGIILIVASLAGLVGVVEADWTWLAAVVPVALVYWPKKRRSLDVLMEHPAKTGWRWDRMNPRNWRR